MSSSIRTLSARLADTFDNAKLLRIIDALAETRDPAAVPVLATVLDTPGPVGRAAVQALIRFGDAAVPTMRECLEAMDEDTIRNAHRVLAALGDIVSAEAQHAYCWSDLGETHPYSVFDLLRAATAA
jgi:HEAT repeat protein